MPRGRLWYRLAGTAAMAPRPHRARLRHGPRPSTESRERAFTVRKTLTKRPWRCAYGSPLSRPCSALTRSAAFAARLFA